MNKIIVPVVIICMLVSSCSVIRKKETVPISNEVTEKPIKSNPVITPSVSGIVELKLINGKGTILIHKNKDQTVYILFESKENKKITAQLSSEDSNSNIRFSQILLPDGTMDGPFGQNLEYDLPLDGMYKLSVHENMMAGSPWSGIFKVEIVLVK